MEKRKLATAFAVLAAALYALNIPFSKILMNHVQTTMMAAFLYLGAGIGLLLYSGMEMALGKQKKKELLTKQELPYTVGMVALDIAAPILLMAGIRRTNAANVSLLNNFEIVATSIIALVIFKEVITKRLWAAIVLVVAASVLLSFEGEGSFVLNSGSVLILLACTCWGFENNCTKMISNKSSEEIVMIKGICSGLGSLVIALVLGETIPEIRWMFPVLLLGFVSYGLSINFYIMAQKEIGAAKTSAYYSIAPFLGVAFSMILLGERPGVRFYLALFIMGISTVLMVRDSISLQHTHEHMHTHTHEHRHGDLVHSHEHTHVHTHIHVHGTDEAQHGHAHTEAELTEHDHAHAAL